MRIFFVTNNYTPYSGGVVQSINAITDTFQKQGHEVFIITLDFLGKKHIDPEHVIRIPCPIKFRYKKNYMAIPWRPTHAIKKLIKQYNPDVVHIHHPFLLGISALRAAHCYGIACVFTYHTLYEEYSHYIPFAGMYSKKLIRAATYTFCTKVDAIIAPSTYVKNYLVAQNITTPIIVIPSPLRICFTKKYFPEKKDFYKKTFKLLLVSRFVSEKNIPFVFDVMKLLPDNFILTLAGYGVDYEKIQVLAFNTLQLCPTRIHFIHKPTEGVLLKLYRNADLFIFPSQTDTQGIVLAESMSQGLPVIALDGPGQQDIIINGVNGFIVRNTKQAAEKIMHIANSFQLHTALIAGAYKRAKEYYPDYITKKLLQFYAHNF